MKDGEHKVEDVGNNMVQAWVENGEDFKNNFQRDTAS